MSQEKVARQALVVFGSTLVWLVLSVPVAEASFPGRNGLIAFAHSHGAYTIRLADPRSGHTRQLTHASRPCGPRDPSWTDGEPSFSASGRFVIYGHRDACDPRVPDGIYMIRVDGRGRRLIRRENTYEYLRYPALSPSGSLFSFMTGLGPVAIATVRRPHSERVLTVSPSNPRVYLKEPAWSSTGLLAVTLDANGRSGHIGIVSPAGNLLRLATRSTRDSSPDWSPSADRIVFQRRPPTAAHRGPDLYLVSMRSGGESRPERLTTRKTGNAHFPVWSPDGRFIAYVRDIARSDGTPTYSLWVVHADGGTPRRLATNLPYERISWQPRPPRRRGSSLRDAASPRP